MWDTVVVPRDTPVTTPVELTTAMPELDVDQVAPEAVPERVVVPPRHTVEAPVMVPAVGGVATVTVIVAYAVEAKV